MSWGLKLDTHRSAPPPQRGRGRGTEGEGGGRQGMIAPFTECVNYTPRSALAWCPVHGKTLTAVTQKNRERGDFPG